MEEEWSRRFEDLRAEFSRNQQDETRNPPEWRGLNRIVDGRNVEPEALPRSRAPTEYRLEKLNDRNFVAWAISLELTLKEEQLWNLLQGKLKNEGQFNERGFNERERDRVYRIIFECVDDQRKMMIADTRDPLVAWKKLKDFYEPSNSICKVESIRNLFGLKMTCGEKMTCYLERARRVLREFLTAGNKAIDDELFAHVIIMGLSKDYAAVRSITNALQSKDLNSKRVEEILLAEYHHKRLEESDDEDVLDGKAMFSRKNSKTKLSDQRTCYNCGKVGHLKRDCRIPQKVKKFFRSAKQPVEDEGKDVDCGKISKNTTSILRGKRVLANGNSTRKDLWILDTGSTHHISNRREDFCEFRELKDEIIWGKEVTSKVMGIGAVKADIQTKGEPYRIKLLNVLFVPDFDFCVMSIGSASSHGWKFHIFNDTLQGHVDGKFIFQSRRQKDNLYPIDLVCLTNTALQSSQSPTISSGNTIQNTISKRGNKGKTTNSALWHSRLGHLSWDSIEEMERKQLVRGLPAGLHRDKDKDCYTCREMKSTKLPFRARKVQRTEEILGTVHSDICGPISPISVGGHRYFATFTDDCSRKSDVFFLHRKSEIVDVFKRYKAKSELETGRKLKVLRTDNGKEYVNHRLDSLLKKWGIKHEKTQSYCPQQNGLSERMNRTLMDKARCLLRDSGLPDRFWGEAVRTSNFLRNICPTKCIDGKVPLEIWSGRHPTVSFLKTFGCKVFAHVPKVQRRGKFDQRGRKCVFLGYNEDRKGYRLWDLENSAILNSRDVVFIEGERGWTTQGEKEKEETESESRLIVLWNGEDENETVELNVENHQEQSTIEDDISVQEDLITEDGHSESEPESEPIIVQEMIPENTPVNSRDVRTLRERTPNVKPEKYSAVSRNSRGNKRARRRDRQKEIARREVQEDAAEYNIVDVFSKYAP
jgi:transposase InsO family protein